MKNAVSPTTCELQKIIDNIMFNNYFVFSEFQNLPQVNPVFLGIPVYQKITKQ